MSQRSFPSFGVSRSAGHKRAVAPPSSEENGFMLPVRDLPKGGELGELLLNSDDGHLYYNVGDRWIAVLIDSNDGLIKLDGGAVLVEGKNVKKGRGGDVCVSSGKGSTSAGKIRFEAGGEPVMTISKDVVVETGSLVLTKGLKCKFAHASTGLDEFDRLQDATLHGPYGVLGVELNLLPNETATGTVNNKLVTEKSLVSVTVVSDEVDAIPYVWLGTPNKGSFDYNLITLRGNVKNVTLNFTVVSSV